MAATAKRRPFSSHEKRRILAAADRCTEVGEIGALLRREGLYSSQLATWRKQRAATERAGLEPQKRGRKADPAHGRGSGGDILMSALHVLAPEIGLAPACVVLHINRAGIYRDTARRRHRLSPLRQPTPRPRAPLALSELERQALREVLSSDRFADCAPRAVYARLLDEGRYVGSVRTMYRLLAVSGQSRERRHQCVHPAYVKPELLAVQRNEVWSGDKRGLRKFGQCAKW